MSNRRLPSEFEMIAHYLAPLAREFKGAFELADDTAVIRSESGLDVVATVDTLVAGVHFLNSDPPTSIGKKLMRVNLSDLAAMGAKPHLYLLSLALSADTDEAWVADFATGLAEDQEAFGIRLAGGDTVLTPGPTTLTLTALGQVAAGKALLRSGAEVGDAIYVTGTIGDGALGLSVLNGGCASLSKHAREHLIARYRLPEPRVSFGGDLIGLAHAAIDISDGLVADLGHLAEQSGRSASVDAACIPLSEAAETACAGDSDLLTAILTGGDDYELLFTGDAAKEAEILSRAKRCNLRVTRIGRIGEGEGVHILDKEGTPVSLDEQGYRHF